MSWLPTNLGTRPRLAVEIRPEGVVSARAEDGDAVVTAVAYAVLREDAGQDQAQGRAAVVAAVKKTLEAVALKERGTTLIVPDTAVRVLLLDFDALPSKTVEAMGVVRFRLKKLLPFEVDEAVVSYQVMSQDKAGVRVLVVAVPKAVLAEYEGVVRAAGFEPGAVLPSTLAACAGLGEDEGPRLLVNAGETSVTTAIVRGGTVLLHRTVDLAAEGFEERLEAAAVREVSPGAGEFLGESAGYGMVEAELAGISSDAVLKAEMLAERIRAEADAAALEMPVFPVTRVEATGPTSVASRDVMQAVSVAAAYFEDTLAAMPEVVMSAGTLGAASLGMLLDGAGFSGMQVRELVEPAMLTGGAVTTRVPLGWMAGVRGALRS